MRIAKTSLALLAAVGAVSVPAAPRKIVSARYPVTSVETSRPSSLALGAANIQVDLSKSDLELIVWKIDRSFALEVNIDVTGVNQSVLPTDASGKLLAKVTELGAVPWIKVYWPGEAPKTLDVTCLSKQRICRGVWKDFPYDAGQEKSLKIEANLRGLEGKIWSPVLNTHRLLPQNSAELGLKTETLNPPYKLKNKADPARVRITAFYDLLRMPGDFAKLKLLSVYDWSFLNDSKLRETGFTRATYKTLFFADKGQFLLETLAQSTLQTQDLPTGRAFMAAPGSVFSFASRKTKELPESTLRALEFE